MPVVSRSFSLCIKILPKPLDEQMMVSYLIYRIIDTIEDSSAPLAVKRKLFHDFLALLQERNFDAARMRSCTAGLCTKLDYTYEKVLLENTGAVLATYYSQPKKVRASIRKWGKTMANGMYEFQKKKIRTFADQDKYSYYVAGVIGNLFNDLLFLNAIIDIDLKRRLSRLARHFGLALQKVNILRDIAQDVSSHRYYWPKKLLAKYGLDYNSLCLAENREKALAILREQVADARKYIDAAMKYILMLPKKALRVRMFCLIPLFMAIESYAKCIDNWDIFDSGKKVKIDRAQVNEIVTKSSLWGTSNERLVNWFLSSMKNSCPDFVREEYKRSLLTNA